MVASPEQDEARLTSRKVAYRGRRQPARSHRLRQSCGGSLSLRILTQPCEAFSQALPLSASPGLLNLPQKIAPHSTFASPPLSPQSVRFSLYFIPIALRSIIFGACHSHHTTTIVRITPNSTPQTVHWLMSGLLACSSSGFSPELCANSDR